MLLPDQGLILGNQPLETTTDTRYIVTMVHFEAQLGGLQIFYHLHVRLSDFGVLHVSAKNRLPDYMVCDATYDEATLYGVLIEKTCVCQCQ
jgi:hypothetical protein